MSKNEACKQEHVSGLPGKALAKATIPMRRGLTQAKPSNLGLNTYSRVSGKPLEKHEVNLS